MAAADAIYDAIVVGGGLLGVATAYHLVRHQANVLMVDRGHPGRATDAGAGILWAETGAQDAGAWVRLARHAVEYYPALVGLLKEDGAGDTGYAQCGLLVVAAGEDERAEHEGARARMLGRGGRAGAPPEEDLREVSPAEARRMFPPLAAVHGALYDRHAARVDGRLLSLALRIAAERRGLRRMSGSVDRLIVRRHRVARAVVDGTAVSTRRAVIAGGAWSQAFSDQLGVPIPVQPQRGQIVHLRKSGVDTTGWPIVMAFRGHYMVPWPDARVAAGATRETGSGFDPRVTAAGVREVLGEALRVAPGLADWDLHEARVGLRPLSRDGLPILGAVPGIEGAFLVTGHGAAGLQLGPYSGKVVADLMLGRPGEIDLAPFSVSRFLG